MKINVRQLSVMLFMSFICLKFLVLPSALYLESGNMSWLVALSLMLIDFIYAFLIISLMKHNQNTNILEFMNECLGKILTKIILLVLAVQLFFQVANITKGLEFFVTENFYNNFNWILYILPLIILTGFMIYKGIRNIARVQEIFYLSIAIGCIYIAIKSIPGIDPMVYLPIFKDGATPLFASGFKHLSWFGSSSFLLLLFGKVDFSNYKKRTILKYLIFAILLVQLIYFIFYGLFDITSPTHTFCISDVSQFSSSKSIIDELSWLVVSLWVVIQSIQIALYGFCLTECLRHIFNIKSKIATTIIVNCLIFALGLIGSKTINFERIFFSNFASITTILAQYIIPLVLWLGYIIKKQKLKKPMGVHHEKVKNNI